MKEKTFEEEFNKEFPSLKRKGEYMNKILNEIPKVDVSTEEGQIKGYIQERFLSAFLNDKVFLLKDIKKHCLDKKRVHKKLRNFRDFCIGTLGVISNKEIEAIVKQYDGLKKELGL